MTFEHSVWLYITLVIVLIAGGMIALGLRRRETLLSQFAASRLLDQLTEKASQTRTLIKAALVILALAAIGIALARPQYGVEWSERKARGLDIVFVLDSSKSMLATDMRPTRLDRAKLAVIDLTERLESDRIGLVAFAGRAFLQTPPTLDYSAFRESLEAVGPGSMTSGGSDLGNAIKEAERAFPKDDNFKIIILLTDGEDLGGNAIETARDAAKNGIKVYAIGIGTPEGDYLRVRNEQGDEVFVRDSDGKPVRSQLDEATLQEIAQLTGGTYSRLSAQSLENLYDSVISTLPREERETELQERKIERFQWMISLAIICLVLDILIRRRSSAHINAALVTVALLAMIPVDSSAQDLPVPEFESEVSEETFAIPEDPREAYNQAYEALTSGDFDTAKTLYQSALSQTDDLALQRDALYNLAHSNYQAGREKYSQGDVEGALELMKTAEEQLNSVNEIDPDDSAATRDLEQVTKVREAVERLIPEENEQENQDQSDESEDGDEGSEEEQENSEDQDSEDSESQDQQDGEQEDGEQQEGDDSQEGESSDEQGEEGEQGSSEGDEQDGEQGEDGEQSSEGEEGSEEGQQSTGDPAEDMAEEEGDEAGEEEGSASQPGEESEGSEDSEGGQPMGQAMQIEGMTQEDAAALLDTLQQSEKLLPFVEQGTPRKGGKLRDW
ncbi:MAG: VWA domain-containing protein [Opitutaceae bacterium]